MATIDELKDAWRQIAKEVDWDNGRIWNAVIWEPLRPVTTDPEWAQNIEMRVVEFSRRALWDRAAKRLAGHVVVARERGEKEWRPLRPLLRHYEILP